MHPNEGTCREKTPSGKNLHINTIPQDINMWNSREYLFRNEIRRR